MAGSIVFSIELLTALGFVPGLLLALAAAPLVRGPTTALLLTLDLAVLIEIVHVVIDPEHRFAAAVVPRLLASAAQVGFAAWLLRAWRRRRPASFAAAAGD
jgi:hypothetical protein